MYSSNVIYHGSQDDLVLVIYHNDDIVVIAINWGLEKRYPSRSDFIKDVLKSHNLLNCKKYILIPANQLPIRYPQKAWVIQENSITIDRSRLIDIKFESLKEERNSLLQQLDAKEIEMWSKGDNNGLNYVRSLKQSLRDLPDVLEIELNAKETIDDIWSYVPNIFKEVYVYLKINDEQE